MGRVVLDSSTLVAMFYEGDKHYKSIASQLQIEIHQYFISAITLSETLTHAFHRGVGENMKAQILDSIDGVIGVGEELAVEAARIRSISNLRLPDALISATATLHDAQLWTFDADLAKVHNDLAGQRPDGGVNKSSPTLLLA